MLYLPSQIISYVVCGGNHENCLKMTMFFWIFHFSKKNGILAARLGAINFTRALSYAKRPLLRVARIACRAHRVARASRAVRIACHMYSISCV